MSVKTFKYRLYPTKSQNTLLRKTLDAARWVYNKTLETRKMAWEERQETVNLYASHKLLTAWKKEQPFLNNAYSQVLQDAQERVDLAFKAFFRRVKAGMEKPGYPRFRSAHRYDSFTYPQFGFRLGGDRLTLSKIGKVKVLLHRPLVGKVKTLTVCRNATGTWYACFACEIEPEPLPVEQKVVGIDVGIESFATLSNGDKIANPRFFRQDEKALAKAQRNLSKVVINTLGRAAKRHVVALVHKRIANRRADFAHKLARRLVNSYGVIAFEDLNVNGMLKNHCLAKSLADAAWNQLIGYAAYKAEDAGRHVVLVNPRNTSKACSRCGTLVDKDLSVRIHNCPHCGLILDRDWNAAINILRLGLQSLGIQPIEAQHLQRWE